MKSTPEIASDKVAIYIRWSTEDQGEGTTLDVQMEGCRHYVLSQGWHFSPDLLFIDDGYSGATLNRPAMERLRERVRQGDVECVVVYKLDRLSRSVADTARLCMDEWDGLCSVKSAREPIDTHTQAGRMFFYTLMNYAEWERSVIRDRTHSGRVRRAQEGRNPGITLPFGYASDPGTGSFVAVPHEAAIVRRIFEAYRLGAGLLKIVSDLNEDGIPFRGGRRWRVSTVAYILSNRAYTGELIWGRRQRNPRYQKRQGERLILLRDEPLVRKEGVFPPIISQAEFEQVEAIRRERPKVGHGGGRSMASGYLLTGFLRCALCGRPMIGHHNDPRRPNGYYYACITRRDQGKAACPAPNIQCRLLDSQVQSKLLSLCEAEKARTQCLAVLLTEARQKLHTMENEGAGIERSLAKLRQREQRLCREYAHERLTLDEFRQLRETLRAEIHGLLEVQKSLTSRQLTLQNSLRNEALLSARIERLQLWEDLPVAQRKHLLRQFVEQVTAAYGEQGLTCDITWKMPSEITQEKLAIEFSNKPNLPARKFLD